MAQLILVRHGQTDWDKQNRIQGTLDLPLNNEGKGEARRISQELSKFKIDAVYSGSASCSLSTAYEIAAPHNLKVKKVKELNGLDHGVWQGLLTKDIKRRYKKQYNLWKIAPTSGKPPRGESIREACDRAVSAMHKIVDKNKGNNVCLVSSDIILSIIKCYLKNIELEQIWKFIPKEAWWEAIEL